MKKVLVVVLALVMAFAFTACGGSDKDSGDKVKVGCIFDRMDQRRRIHAVHERRSGKGCERKRRGTDRKGKRKRQRYAGV